MTAIRVGINGLGRIGRLVLRRSLKRTDADGPVITVAAVNDLAPPETLAYLLSHDSVHRWGLPTVHTAPGALVVDGCEIPLSCQQSPAEIDWARHDVDLVIEATGNFTTRKGLSGHLRDPNGPRHAVLAAPGQDLDFTVVLGVNDDHLDPTQHRLISNASCTTNAMAPVLAILDQAFGVEWALVNTTHSYTTGQGLTDSPVGKDLRRGRAAGINIVPTTTSAASALLAVLPHLRGRVDGSAVRVPVVNGSLFELVCALTGTPSLARVLETLAAAAATPKLQSIVSLRREPLVSSDILGDTHSSIIDVECCMSLGPWVRVVGWYDNESGYSARLLDLIARLGPR